MEWTQRVIDSTDCCKSHPRVYNRKPQNFDPRGSKTLQLATRFLAQPREIPGRPTIKVSYYECHRLTKLRDGAKCSYEFNNQKWGTTNLPYISPLLPVVCLYSCMFYLLLCVVYWR